MLNKHAKVTTYIDTKLRTGHWKEMCTLSGMSVMNMAKANKTAPHHSLSSIAQQDALSQL